MKSEDLTSFREGKEQGFQKGKWCDEMPASLPRNSLFSVWVNLDIPLYCVVPLWRRLCHTDTESFLLVCAHLACVALSESAMLMNFRTGFVIPLIADISVD